MHKKNCFLLAALTVALAQAQAADRCLSCHEQTPDISGMTAGKIHARHIGVTPQPEGNCLQCHDDQNSMTFAKPVYEPCAGCHTDIDKAQAHAAQQNFKKADCAQCHPSADIRKAHLGKFETALNQGQMGIASVDVTNAHLIQKDGKPYIELSFRLNDANGKPVAVKGGDPANADWIKNLQLYVNFGLSSDFLSPRGYSLFVKSNKRDITQKGTDTTPAGERLRTPMVRSENNVFTYHLGPVVTADAISGDHATDLGVIADRLIYCFDASNHLISCDAPGSKKNAAWNHLWYFDQNGLVDQAKASAVRPAIVSNANCGTCHGYFEGRDSTNIDCRNCHSRKTAKNKLLADTTCFSGHDDINGEHVKPFMKKPMTQRSLPGFGSSTRELTLSCIVCHNANTPPTAALRDRHVVAGEPHFIENLILSSPDHKIWMHGLHSNTRPTARDTDSVRHVFYSARSGDCTRCHVGNSYAIDRLTDKGRPIALDTTYNSDSSAHPALDFKVNAYASPVAATCLSCHAYTTGKDGKRVFNEKASAHMKAAGAAFGVPLQDIKKETCVSCHTQDNLKQVHKLD